MAASFLVCADGFCLTSSFGFSWAAAVVDLVAEAFLACCDVRFFVSGEASATTALLSAYLTGVLGCGLSAGALSVTAGTKTAASTVTCIISVR